MKLLLRGMVLFHGIALLASSASLAQSGWFVQVPAGEGATLNAISALDAKTAIAVGNSGTILRTIDGGDTWTSQPSGTKNDLRGVSFIDANTATAVGRAGTILRTTNGGDTWETQLSGTSYDLKSVFFLDPETGTAVGGTIRSGVIVRTTDGGGTWTVVRSTDFESFHGVAFSDANNGLVVGSRSLGISCPCTLVLQSTNGGLTWAERHVGWQRSESLASVSYGDADHVTAVGGQQLGATILRSNDGGWSWVAQSTNESINTLSAVSFVDLDVGTAVGGAILPVRGAIIRTTDGGATWMDQQLPPGSTPLRGVSFVDANTGTAVGDDGLILRTNTGGK